MPLNRMDGGTSDRPLHVSLLVLPESMAGPLIGLYEDFNGLPWARAFFEDLADFRPIVADIVTPGESLDVTANGLPIRAQRRLREVERTDVVILASLYVPPAGWSKGRHAETIDWLRRMHANGALLCSTCTGVFPLAETGLLDGLEATVHWGMAKLFSNSFPNTRLRIRDAMVVTGKRREFAMGGASASWHDMLLYVVSRFSDPDIARALAKFLLISWHQDGQAFCSRFSPSRNHGDAMVLALERWLGESYALANPVEEMMRRSGLPERTFKRRFTNATEYSPIHYVQELRVEKAKGALESGDDSVEAISWQVGYEDASYFRALFKRLTGISPGEYRRKYRVPAGL